MNEINDLIDERDNLVIQSYTAPYFESLQDEEPDIDLLLPETPPPTVVPAKRALRVNSNMSNLPLEPPLVSPKLHESKRRKQRDSDHEDVAKFLEDDGGVDFDSNG